jgi:hypothetical protein
MQKIRKNPCIKNGDEMEGLEKEGLERRKDYRGRVEEIILYYA